MNLGIATFIENKVGRFVGMDMEESGRSWGASMRIRAAINVTLPLVRALRVVTTMGDEVVVSLTYERLQNFCYLCGHLDHISKFCAWQFEEGFEDPGDETPYGPWLRAPVSSWGNSRTSKSPESRQQSRKSGTIPVRGPSVYGDFGGVRQPVLSTVGKDKDVASNEMSHNKSQEGKNSADSVYSEGQSSSEKHGVPDAPNLGFPSMSVQSFIPETRLVEQERFMQVEAVEPDCVTEGLLAFQAPELQNRDEVFSEPMHNSLFSVPIRFAAVPRGGAGRRRRGQRRAVRGVLAGRKRSRGIVLEPVGGEVREVKRRHLFDEDTDILSAEVATQPRRSP
ncbi:UNVERIFIED_CONTAM: hypothetical protein Sradi_2028800 [Sesamum radiatum]|uniref:Zinc knuckle CX2CX4HX4C domain-containing protein n=1 Tax=Sesamum radiatum TaxID=300843 RepID=A0AAW2TGH7_SESRA